MKTILHAYYFDLDTRQGKRAGDGEAYKAMCDMLRAQGLKVFASIRPKSTDSHYLPVLDGEIELETKHLFSNQWNTPTHRVFDWAEDVVPNRSIKMGHWLEQTEEMRAIRANTATCGFCGHQEPVGQNQFCPKCIGSEYLKRSDVYLLRMLPINQDSRTRAFLTDEEARKILPRYEHAQGLGVAARTEAKLSKRRQRIADLMPEAHKKAADLIANARLETDALTWLMDNGYRDIENVIYYPHTQKFGFGWRTPLDAAEVSALLDIITEFPFMYEIKAADGRKLTRDA
jgi:hypothetical protein